MSSLPQNLVATNLKPEDMVMDTRGDKDARYYCLPPFRGDRSRPASRRGGGYPWHLVFQGHRVGLFNAWPEAKLSLAGFGDSGNQGFNTEEDAIEAWQGMCVLGVHPHPVDPAFLKTPAPSASTYVNSSPRKSSQRSPQKSSAKPGPVKREPASGEQTQLLADLKRYCSPILPPSPNPPSPRKQGDRAPPTDDSRYVNFAIRGGGIISSSVERSERRYRELQEQGEEPDMLVTRDFAQASLFALEEDE